MDEPLVTIQADQLYVFGEATIEVGHFFTMAGHYRSRWQVLLWRLGLRRDEPALRVYCAVDSTLALEV